MNTIKTSEPESNSTISDAAAESVSPLVEKLPKGNLGEREISAVTVLATKRPEWLIAGGLIVFFVNMALAWSVTLLSNRGIQASLMSSESGGESTIGATLKLAPQANPNTMILLHRVVEASLYQRLISNKQTLLVVGMALAFGLMSVGFALYVFGVQSAFHFSGRSGPSFQVALTSTTPGLLCFILATIIASIALTREAQVKLSDFTAYPDASILSSSTSQFRVAPVPGLTPFDPVEFKNELDRARKSNSPSTN